MLGLLVLLAIERMEPERERELVERARSMVRTPGGVRAEVATGGENLIRLDYGSEAAISGVGEGRVAVELRSGKGYCRARKGTSFRASGGGLEAGLTINCGETNILRVWRGDT
jgi:hypothetical protein